MKMDVDFSTSEDGRSELVSDVVDLRSFPLRDLPALAEDVRQTAIGRIVLRSSFQPVPVAAFNSAI